eukprot:g8193.t1 g8193   contig28:79576-81650(+)
MPSTSPSSSTSAETATTSATVSSRQNNIHRRRIRNTMMMTMSLLPTVLAVLSLFLGSSSSMAAASSSSSLHCHHPSVASSFVPSLATASSTTDALGSSRSACHGKTRYNKPSRSSQCTTALYYKNLADDHVDDTTRSSTTSSNSNSINNNHHPRSKRTKLKPSRKNSRKKFLKSTTTTTSSNNYESSYRKNIPTTHEDLTKHVQSVLSEDNYDGLDVIEDDCDLFSEDEDGGGSGSERHLETMKKLERHPSLVLNADYQPLRMLPLSIWSWQDTVKAVLGGKAHVVEVYPDVVVRAVNLDMPVPSVIALKEYAHTGKARPAFTRRNVFLRDGYRCQYCSGLFRTSDLSLDHVEPRCFGGKLTWENTVTSCRKCNGRKGCLRPTEIHHIGMTLKSKPRCPSLYELAAEANKFVPRRVHPTWAPFLGIDEDDDGEEEEKSSTSTSFGGNTWSSGSSLPRP